MKPASCPPKMLSACAILLLLSSGMSFAQSPNAGPPKPKAAVEEGKDPNAELMKSLNRIVTDMGLQISSVGQNEIDIMSKGDPYSIVASGDGDYVFLNVWWNIPKDKASQIPLQKMLEWNSIHATYFGIEQADDGHSIVTMSESFESKGVNPALIRKRLDLIEADSDSVTGMFDTSKWK